MNAISSTASASLPRRQAGSLSRTLGWHLQRVWAALERSGQRRAAPEIARAASRLADTEPALAAELLSLSRRWRAR